MIVPEEMQKRRSRERYCGVSGGNLRQVVEFLNGTETIPAKQVDLKGCSMWLVVEVIFRVKVRVCWRGGSGSGRRTSVKSASGYG